MRTKSINCATNYTKTIFIARDGEEFEDNEQCENYEKAQKTLAEIKYSKLVKCNISEYGLFLAGSEEDYYDIVRINSSQDLEVLLNAYSWMGYPKSEEELAKIKENLKTGEVYLIYRGYDGDAFSNPQTKENIIAPIISAIDEAINRAGLSADKNE